LKPSDPVNITADHLDRYPNFEAYTDSKIRIFKNQQAEDVAVLNGGDALVRAKTKRIKSQRLFFPSIEANEQGAILNGKRIILNLNKLKGIQPKIQIPKSKFQILKSKIKYIWISQKYIFRGDTILKMRPPPVWRQWLPERNWKASRTPWTNLKVWPIALSM
jgi:hypothetical protein